MRERFRFPYLTHTMSAFEGPPLDIALRDCGIDTFAVVGIAIEIGIEPTVRHGADLGYIPAVVKDACGSGHRDAERSIASLEFAADAFLTDVEAICARFGAYNPDRHHQKGSCVTHTPKSLQLALLVLHAPPSEQATTRRRKSTMPSSCPSRPLF